jgi:hypothetical protein
MEDRSQSVHVHKSDATQVVRDYREKGYTLKERAKPTIPAQDGFIRLIFVPTADILAADVPKKTPLRSFWEMLSRQLIPRSR